jgi:arylsulfatase A-like enzyme
MNGAQRPDILMIVLDTLRADRLSCYGYHRETSPYLDEFARGGVLYERALSTAQWTIPAHASLFTGEYPTTHMMNQIYDKLNKNLITLAETLHREGYITVGFCNNPLLGVVENGLDRGFEEFYNYGGTLPNRPAIGDSRATRAGRITQRFYRILRRILTPAQDAFARSNLLLRIALHPLVVPLWQRYVNFKGNTAQSLRDTLGYLRTHRHRGDGRPVFAFVNLMETHLPFGPRARAVRKFVPYYRNDREIRSFMQAYNKEHYAWMVPLREPLTEAQHRVINDMYDAEVATEDSLLRRLYQYLDDPEVRDNTLVIITSDHGEGLDHHHFVGHSLVVYDDLVRVPLIVRYPRLYPPGVRVSSPVSIRRAFHSALEAAGVYPAGNGTEGIEGAPVEVERLSLARSADGADPEDGIVFAEAHTPDTLIALMENLDPAAIETFRCREMRRAVLCDSHKLIEVGEQPDELFDVLDDPGELDNLIEQAPQRAAELDGLIRAFVEHARVRRPAAWEAAQQQLQVDSALAERLRGLGYLG